MSNNNLYKSPESDVENIQNSTDELEKCLAIAKRQKALLYSFLAYFTLIAISAVLKSENNFVIQLLSLPVLIAIIVFTGRLCWILYGKIGAVIMIFFSIIPILNFLVYLFANSRANRHLKNKGFKVGLMGVNIAEIESRLENN